MKTIISLLLLCALTLGLCACADEPVATTTAAPEPTTTVTEPGCVHVYKEADCVNPMTCTLCGQTRGSAQGHDYIEGVCSQCGEADSTYVALLDGVWHTDALHEDGSQLEYIILEFFEDGTAYFSAGIYERLSDLSEEEREMFINEDTEFYDYSGEVYYYAGFGVGDELVYTVEGQEITCELRYDDTVYATLILERTGGNMLTVTYFEGQCSIYYLQVGDVLSCEQ